VRDDHGKFVAEPSHSVDFDLDATSAEAVALHNGMCNKLVIKSAYPSSLFSEAIHDPSMWDEHHRVL
jgi:hypothetical protein